MSKKKFTREDYKKHRDYGKSNSELIGDPVMVGPGPAGEKCPNCGSTDLNMMQAIVVNAFVTGGRGKGAYIECGSCPWASEMAIVALGAYIVDPEEADKQAFDIVIGRPFTKP